MWEANGCAAGQPYDFYINGDYSEIHPRGVAGVTELSLSPFFLKFERK